MKRNLGFAEGILMAQTKNHAPAGYSKVFDWVKAAKIIKDECRSKTHCVSAGLSEDWSCTSGDIYVNGEFVKEEETYVYLKSSWATPILDIDGDEFECWVYENETKYNEKTYWPEEAKDILINLPT